MPDMRYPIQRIPLARIRPPADPLRLDLDPERIAALADDIAAQGLLQPIGLRGPDGAESYEVVWGHRRYLAHELLERADIEARIFPAGMDPLHAGAMENLGQERMTPIEEALLCQRYVERGQPVAAIARLLRHSATWVDQRLALLGYPRDVQEAVQAGALTLVVAGALAEIDHDEYRGSLIAEATRTGATAATVRVWAAHYAVDRERIIQNRVAVEIIAREREAFVLYTRCEIGGHDVPVSETRSIRGCEHHLDELVRALQLVDAAPTS